MIKKPFKKIDLTKEPNKREKILIIVGIVIGIFAAVNWRILPVNNLISAEKNRLTELTREKSEIQEWLKNVKAPKPIEIPFIGLKSDVDKAVEIMLQPLDLRGITISSSKFGDVVHDFVYSRNIEFNLSGRFNDILRYLKNLETLPAPLIIGQLSLTSPPTAHSPIILDIKGTLYGR